MMKSRRTTLGFKGRLFSLFAGYVLVSVAFGLLYQTVYKNDRNSFMFNESLHDRKELGEQIDILTEIEQANSSNAYGIARAYPRTRLPITQELALHIDYRNNTTEYEAVGSLEVTRPSEKSLRRAHELIEEVEAHYVKTGEWLSIDCPVDLYDAIKKMTQTYANYERQSQVVGDYDWGFVDFWYFSIVTISTLGYGDMLPNNRFVRGIVITEVLMGLLLVVFLLNIVLGHQSGT